MPGRTDYTRHARLVDRMAGTLGIDLDEQMMRGRVTASQIDDAVLGCTGCTRPCDCESWLAAQEGAAPEAPGYCRNTTLFEALRDT
ncbi:DUF6455 family protein [Salipiger sp.]|uniref:DUF6455 family protein n=1 Tax=Salipiger sp. TaxID=2078585 RepID=UPI003A97A7FB